MQLPTKTNNCQELNEDDPEFIKLVGYGTQAGLDLEEAKRYARQRYIKENSSPRKKKPDRSPETIQARSTGTAPESHPSTDEKSVNKEQLSTVNKISQPQMLPDGKVLMWGKLLTAHAPYYTINEQLANCWQLTGNERCLIGLLNFLAQKYSYASVSFEQLAWWIGLHKPKSPKSMENMIRKLGKAGFIEDHGEYPGGKHKLVVCLKWRNPKASVDAKRESIDAEDIPF